MITYGTKYYHGTFEPDASDTENLGVNFWKMQELLNFQDVNLSTKLPAYPNR